MTRDEIKECLYNKYILPTEEARERYIGVEIEMPVVNLTGEGTIQKFAQNAMLNFCKEFGFTEDKWDENGICFSATKSENEDNISFDCSYNNLELSLGKAVSISEIEQRFREYVTYINKELQKNNHILTGMGVNPNREVNDKTYIPSERYRMLEHYLKQYKMWDIPMYFHSYPDFGAFSSASQVQLDIDREHLLPVLKAFSLLEPVKSVLFNNSVLPNETDVLCVRDSLWENSTHGINPHNVGLYDCDLEDTDDFLEYLCTLSIFCVERDGHYINFCPILITDYLERETVEGEYYENGSYHTISFTPDVDDLKYLRTYKFEDLTFRGTIEFRSVCCQPFKDAMSVAAFHVGLMDRPNELIEIFNEDYVLYHHGYSAKELRKIMNQRAWPEYIDREGLVELCLRVLQLSKEGLINRGFGEERYLKPLFARADSLLSPARKMVEALENGIPMSELVKEYAAFE